MVPRPVTAPVLPHAGSAGAPFFVECTFVATICEDHFVEQQAFRYGACALDGNTSNAFGPTVLHLLNLHGTRSSPGERLRLLLRNATESDLRAQHQARRRLQLNPLHLPTKPLWYHSGRGLSSRARRVCRDRSPLFPGRPFHRSLTRRGSAGPSSLTICMQHTLLHQLDDSWKPWTKECRKPHSSILRSARPALGTNTPFYIINMDSSASPEKLDPPKCPATHSCRASLTWRFFCEGQVSRCNLDYMHIEFIVPENLDDLRVRPRRTQQLRSGRKCRHAHP